MTEPLDIEAMRATKGRERQLDDTLAPDPVNALAAALGKEGGVHAGDPLPPLRHWLYFREHVARGDIGPDGHPRPGGFLPATPFPRRMWAGGSLRFYRPLSIGSAVERVTRVEDVQCKQGRNGDLLFVTLAHTLRDGAGVAIEEVQDLVYRPAATLMQEIVPSSPADAAADRYDWQESVQPDPVLLFRFSAATNNSHRIHYDLSYAREAEYYPNLVVHGPLTATLLMDAAIRWTNAQPAAFRFRGVSPAYVHEPLSLGGRKSDVAGRWDLEARTAAGRLVMSAEFTA